VSEFSETVNEFDDVVLNRSFGGSWASEWQEENKAHVSERLWERSDTEAWWV